MAALAPMLCMAKRCEHTCLFACMRCTFDHYQYPAMRAHTHRVRSWRNLWFLLRPPLVHVLWCALGSCRLGVATGCLWSTCSGWPVLLLMRSASCSRTAIGVGRTVLSLLLLFRSTTSFGDFYGNHQSVHLWKKASKAACEASACARRRLRARIAPSHVTHSWTVLTLLRLSNKRHGQTSSDGYSLWALAANFSAFAKSLVRSACRAMDIHFAASSLFASAMLRPLSLSILQLRYLHDTAHNASHVLRTHPILAPKKFGNYSPNTENRHAP